jgi:hypothetical protein
MNTIPLLLTLFFCCVHTSIVSAPLLPGFLLLSFGVQWIVARFARWIP